MFNVGDTVRVIAENASEIVKSCEYIINTAEIACKGLQFKIGPLNRCWFPDELELVRHSPTTTFTVGDIVQFTSTLEPLPEYRRYDIPPVASVRVCKVESVRSPCPFSETNVHYNLVTIDGERRRYGSNGSNLTPNNYTLF